MDQLKDDVLAQLAHRTNIAQFVSVRAEQPRTARYALVRGQSGKFGSLRDAIDALIEASLDGKVNVRTFSSTLSKGGEFVMGLGDTESVLMTIDKFTRKGVSVIVNESIDIHDGGVSGVFLGSTIEFSPDDTPRCVEKPGLCRLPRDIGLHLLRLVYGVSFPDSFGDDERVEFSIHPRRQGIRNQQFIVWEAETQVLPVATRSVPMRWPNRFSQHIGDKTFGLLVAHLLGHYVPASTVISRRIRPFFFGTPTGTNEYWYRTAPRRQLPGKLPTVHGHQDLFSLLEDVAPEDRDALASVIVQEGVDATYSGGAAVRQSGELVIEGVQGHGDEFMLGNVAPSELPQFVQSDVEAVVTDLRNHLGPCRIEWVSDGGRTWVVQLHVGAISSDPVRIVDGNVDEWIDFDVKDGLEKLRSLLIYGELSGKGIRLLGDVGVTSHFGDLLRGKGIPSCIIRTPPLQTLQWSES